jgi:16S rRNA (cytidine1402-2'-O)-methyltransferase
MRVSSAPGSSRSRRSSAPPRGLVPLAVCATPIGNLEDVTLRVLRELSEADLVLCEDTRRTRILLDRHGIQARLESYHRHNEAARTVSVLERLRRGERIALVSDAGLPGVNDPGGRLIVATVEAGIPVTVLPGASALETALVVSAMPADRFQFLGYLPRRVAELRKLAAELARWPDAAVFFESPRRLPSSLSVLAEVMPERRAAVCRELTKRFEDVVRGTLAELAERFAEPPRGEVTVVLGPTATTPDDRSEDAIAAVAELVSGGMPRRQAVDLVARLTGTARNQLYRASL